MTFPHLERASLQSVMLAPDAAEVACAIAATALLSLRERLDRRAFQVAFELERELARLRLTESEFCNLAKNKTADLGLMSRS